MKNLIVLCLFLLPFVSNAQKSHTVAAKESLYSIARLYKIHPKELAAYNNISIDDGLVIGQVVKIPAKKNMAPLENTTPKPEPVAAAIITNKTSNNPLYHLVLAKEGLYSISKQYNVTIDQIKQWNNLPGNDINIGEKLIVGYQQADTKPVAKKTEPVKEPVAQTAVEQKEATIPVVKQQPAVVKQASPAQPIMASGESFFKQGYDAQTKDKSVATETGIAGIFKSTSGWEDGKFYCLHNTAPAGSFVKITYPRTQKTVYAKVLDLMPDLKENGNYKIRISNAAAAALGDDGLDFECTVSF